jgi:hypothetical protein
VLVLQGRVVAGLLPATTLGMLVARATVFGAAQQVVTRVVDQRVAGLLHEAAGPSISEEG